MAACRPKQQQPPTQFVTRKLSQLVLCQILLLFSFSSPNGSIPLLVSGADVVATNTNPDGPCTVCRGTTDVPLPSKTIDLSSLGVLECGNANSVLGLIFPNASNPACQTIQAVGGICGCPPLIENGCDFCLGSPLSFPDRKLPGALALEADEDSSAVAAFSEVDVSCEMLHSIFMSTYQNDDPVCQGIHWIFGDYCGCTSIHIDWHEPCRLCASPSMPDAKVGEPDRPLLIDGIPYDTCGKFEAATELLFIEGSEQCDMMRRMLQSYCVCPQPEPETPRCSLCTDGSAPTKPHTPFPFLKSLQGPDIGWDPTCVLMDSFASTLARDSKECIILQLTGSYCGCPGVEDSCDICPGETIPEEYRDVVINGLEEFMGFAPDTVGVTCGMTEFLQDQVHRDDTVCRLAYRRRDLCGCNDGIFVYNEADTLTKQALLVWMPRITALLSMIVSDPVLLSYLLFR